MVGYYAIRVVAVAVVVALLAVGGSPWWAVTAMGVVMLGLVLGLHRSGWYVVGSKGGAGSLRRDERAQSMSRVSARNGFIAVMVGLAVVGVCFAALDRDVPVDMVALLVALGWVTYFVSHLWLRRS
jgi:hypothetical protein